MDDREKSQNQRGQVCWLCGAGVKSLTWINGDLTCRACRPEARNVG